MTETEFCEFLQESVSYFDEDAAGDGDDDHRVEDIHTYADRGILTMNNGLVFTMADGTEFHVTVVESTPRF